MRALRWKHTAREDLLTIVTYIADDNPDAAQALKDEIEAKAGQLPAHPKLYREGRVPGTHEMVIGKHYVVVYAENQDSVDILRVLHTSRQWP